MCPRSSDSDRAAPRDANTPSSRPRGRNSEPIPSRPAAANPSLLRLLEQALLRDDHDDAGLGDVIFLPVFFQIEPDLRALRDMDVAVDDGAPDARIAGGFDVGHQDGGLDFGVAGYAHGRRKNGVRGPPAGYDPAPG